MRLTRREQEVGHLVAAGLTNKAIAETIHVSERRVENLVVAVGHKIGVDHTRNVRVQIATHFARTVAA